MSLDKKRIFAGVRGFDWDHFNAYKNLFKHRVTPTECEQIFFNVPLIINDDHAHGDVDEERYIALGKTDNNRRLFVVFELRDGLVRPISFRDMEKNERAIYETFT